MPHAVPRQSRLRANLFRRAHWTAFSILKFASEASVEIGWACDIRGAWTGVCEYQLLN